MILTLRALQSSARNSNNSAPLTWKALSVATQNSGSPGIDYERFSAQYDSEDENGILHQLVDRFDVNGLVLKTATQGDLSASTKEKESSISKTAKNVARKAFS